MKALLLLALAALAAEAFWLEPSSLRLTRYAIALPDAPKLQGLRIAVIADLHGGAPYIDAAKIDAVVAMANDARPDLILLPGDFVGHVYGAHPMAIEDVVAHLKPLKAPLGVYAVLGNHDHWLGANLVESALRRGGIVVLRNAHAVIATPRGPLYLAGIDDDYSHAADPAHAVQDIPPGAAALCLTHSPDIFPRLAPVCALTIAGHTHGGQVSLPLVGSLFVPSRFGRRYVRGVVREDGKTLFVSPGIGTSIIGVRLGVAPEVSFLTLQ